MSQVTRSTIKLTTVFFVLLALTALVPVVLFAADPIAAHAEVVPWWQQVETFQNFAMKWIAALTVVLGAIATLAAYILSKIQEIKGRLDRHETRIANNTQNALDAVAPKPVVIQNDPTHPVPVHEQPTGARASKRLVAWLIGGVFLFSSSGCGTITEFARSHKSEMYLIANLAMDAADAYQQNGGGKDSLYSIGFGLNALSDVGTYAKAKVADKIAAQAVKDYAAKKDKDPAAELATNLATIIALQDAKSPADASKLMQAVAVGVQNSASNPKFP